MSLEVIVYILTALAGVVVVLTRLRLRDEEGTGHYKIGPGLLNLHTVAGTLALVFWVVFLIAGEDTPVGGSLVGIVVLGLWWVTVIAGLLLLVRWLPSRGRHSTDVREASWSQGPGSSILAHVGLLVGVLVFTFAYLTAAV